MIPKYALRIHRNGRKVAAVRTSIDAQCDECGGLSILRRAVESRRRAIGSPGKNSPSDYRSELKHRLRLSTTVPIPPYDIDHAFDVGTSPFANVREASELFA